MVFPFNKVRSYDLSGQLIHQLQYRLLWHGLLAPILNHEIVRHLSGLVGALRFLSAGWL